MGSNLSFKCTRTYYIPKLKTDKYNILQRNKRNSLLGKSCSAERKAQYAMKYTFKGFLPVLKKY